MHQHGSIDPRTLGWGQNIKIQLFSEHGQVTDQIKGNYEFSNMQGYILSLHAPWGEVKGQNIFFLKLVTLLINAISN